MVVPIEEARKTKDPDQRTKKKNAENECNNF